MAQIANGTYKDRGIKHQPQAEEDRDAEEAVRQHKKPSAFVPDSIHYQRAVFKAGLHSAKSPFTFQAHRWEPLAKEVLSGSAWGYIHGTCGAGTTYAKNLAAFDRWSILPSPLVPSRRDANGVELFSDTSTTVLGQKLPFPLATAPIGVQKIFNGGGECAAARAAASVDVPFTLASASCFSIESVAEASGQGSLRWYHLNCPLREHDDITVSLLQRAKKSGYSALFVTLDTYLLGWRPRDMDNGYNPFIHPDRIGVEIGLTDPVFRRKFKEKHGYEIGEDSHHDNSTIGDALSLPAREWNKIMFPGHSHSWEDVAFLREHWDGPIVLKRIQSVRDAKKAVQVGVQGIVVSNHGGRQTDGGPGTLELLPGIVDAVGHQLDVFLDSGIRCGADVIKAIALGAKCVLIGRPYAYGLSLGGEEGVRHVLRAIARDLLLNMHLAGLRSLEEVDRDVLIKSDLFQ